MQTQEFGVPNADEYVAANFRTLGLETQTASYWFHKILVSCFLLYILFNTLLMLYIYLYFIQYFVI